MQSAKNPCAAKEIQQQSHGKQVNLEGIQRELDKMKDENNRFVLILT